MAKESCPEALGERRLLSYLVSLLCFLAITLSCTFTKKILRLVLWHYLVLYLNYVCWQTSKIVTLNISFFLSPYPPYTLTLKHSLQFTTILSSWDIYHSKRLSTWNNSINPWSVLISKIPGLTMNLYLNRRQYMFIHPR